MSWQYWVTLTLFLLLGCYTSNASSQEPASLDASGSQKSPRPLEEITVVGERTLLTMRYQIRREEDNLYRLFNELNGSDEFDIKCRMVKRASHIPRRECEPRFVTRARSANAIMGLAEMRGGVEDPATNTISLERGLSLIATESELGEQEGNKFDAMNAQMLQLALENPDYLNALMRVNALKIEFDAKWQETFGKKE